MIFGIHLGARECDWTFWTSPVSVGRSNWSLRIRGVWQSVFLLRNAPGPSGAPLPDMASPSRSLRISLECKLSGVSGPSEPHLPDTARLRRPLRTTQETGLNHFSPSDWRVPFAPENPRPKQFSPQWTKLVLSIKLARFTSDRENGTKPEKRENEEKTVGKDPKRAARISSRKHGPTTTRRSRNQRRKGAGTSWARLGDVQCPLTLCFLNVTDPFGLSSDMLSGSSTAHWPLARLTGLLHLKMTSAKRVSHRVPPLGS